MRILCTGGAGYLGSVLVPSLLRLGNQVTVLDNFMFGQTSLNHICGYDLFEVVKGDCRDTNVLKPLLAKADIFIPLAARVGAPLCDQDPLTAWSVNADAIHLAVNMMSREQQIIIPISNSGYGIGEKGKECTEESPLRPVSVYGRTKVTAENIALGYGNTVSLRLATVFGMSPRMRLDLLVNDFVYRAVNDKAIVLFEPYFKRNYIHIKDVAYAFDFAIRYFDQMKNEVYNVGLSNANLSKWELCEVIAQHVPGFVFMEAPIGQDPDKRDYIVSNAKFEKLGWHPQVSLDKGIEELKKGYVMLNDRHYGNA